MCQSKISDRLIEEAALFLPGSECNYPVAPRDFDRLISGYRLIWGYRLIGGPPLFELIIF